MLSPAEFVRKSAGNNYDKIERGNLLAGGEILTKSLLRLIIQATDLLAV